MRVRVSRYYCNSACSAAATIDTGLDTGHGANTMDGLLHWAWYRRCAALRLRLQHLFPLFAQYCSGSSAIYADITEELLTVFQEARVALFSTE